MKRLYSLLILAAILCMAVSGCGVVQEEISGISDIYLEDSSVDRETGSAEPVENVTPDVTSETSVKETEIESQTEVATIEPTVASKFVRTISGQLYKTSAGPVLVPKDTDQCIMLIAPSQMLEWMLYGLSTGTCIDAEISSPVTDGYPNKAQILDITCRGWDMFSDSIVEALEQSGYEVDKTSSLGDNEEGWIPTSFINSGRYEDWQVLDRAWGDKFVGYYNMNDYLAVRNADNGTYYAFLCRYAPLEPEAEFTLWMATVYEDHDGDCSIINWTPFDVEALYKESLNEYKGEPVNLGEWEAEVPSGRYIDSFDDPEILQEQVPEAAIATYEDEDVTISAVLYHNPLTMVFWSSDKHTGQKSMSYCYLNLFDYVSIE